MELDPTVPMLLRELDPTAAGYVTVKGTNIAKLERALYGCVQYARLWYEKLRDTLVSIGFIVNNYDLCVFNKMVNGVQVTVVFHADDLLLTCTLDEVLDEVIDALRGQFAGVTAVRGAEHSYLAMNIETRQKLSTCQDTSGKFWRVENCKV